MDDLERQFEEVELLKNIYPDEFKIESEAGRTYYTIELAHNDTRVYLCFGLPEDYPSASPPVCEMSAPSLGKAQKDAIYDELNRVYLDNLGETVLYQWIERVREMLEVLEPTADADENVHTIKNDEVEIVPQHVINCPAITHGEIIEDRKSHFQAHVAVLKSRDEIDIVVHTLKQSRKINEAAHNIVAWRFGSHQDCDDDGEKAAGGRLLHLLELLNVENVVVVVSRWFGGIHLGPVRFRHINNAARQVLIQVGLVKQ